MYRIYIYTCVYNICKYIICTCINTGEEAILHVDKAPEVYVPPTVATAEPRKTKQHKLDKLGIYIYKHIDI
jgi:hypothetical protein